MLNGLIRIAAVAAITAGLAGPAQSAELQDIIDKGTVRIGVPIDVPPFGFMDENNEPTGLDVEVAQAIGEALGVEVELQQITGANRVPYLVTDRLDMVIAAMGATPERAQQVAFSSPYSALSIGVFGPADIAVTTPAELGDTSIAVARGTTQDIELTAAAPDANIMRFDDDATAAAAYLSGQTQLLATANVVAKELSDRDPNVELQAKFILRMSPTHIAIQQGNPELLRWLDTFVFYNLTTKQLSKITEKWLGQPLPANFPSM
ncbi:transporter substrate-binding domain-containing protein [Microbaculum marinisediminis]|uniref:Transporter substrate-binding domain-containing protein n=1 Tax=Microbaculum marinisediminis TaxID=2931392 RepID=A0AAW5QTV3_9HYPH|nr:transporter substrate-binding domain-containing protein [Microbaculum sp. A6E488]MCT8970914.1 transporter substrate-binding domain-containing protein [Microbaculum sp. A6E488]